MFTLSFVGFIAVANAFTMPKAPQRLIALKSAEEPWFPDSQSSVSVDLSGLKYVLYHLF